jgi:hemolysin D
LARRCLDRRPPPAACGIASRFGSTPPIDRSIVAIDAGPLAKRRGTALGQALIEALRRDQLMQLAPPVDGTLRKLCVQPVGGVASEAQPLMVIVPAQSPAEVDVAIDKTDFGFIRPGQDIQPELETCPFTRYGTVPGRSGPSPGTW